MYQGKNLFRDFGFSFWALIYPLILAGFFYLAFSGMMNIELENINVGIEEGNRIEFILEEIEIFNVYKVNESQAEEKLKDDEIKGFIDKDLNLMVKESGIEQTIIKEVVEQIKQMESLNRPIENYDFEVDYIVNRNQEANILVIIFYSLIAMVSTYGVFAGITVVNLIQANLSNIGARLNITPLEKHKFLLAGAIVGLALNLLANGVLLIFIKYILKLQLFNEFKYTSIFIILGNLFGTALGILIGASNRKSENVKIIIGIAITLFLSFLSGLMGPNIKVILDKKIPIIGRINPISIISNNLYRINLLESTKSAHEGIILLSLYSILLIFSSYLFLRRRDYDSI